MQRIHVTKTYKKDIKSVFSAISNHSVFLSGGGIRCEMIQTGNEYPNGDGAIRKIVAAKLTFEEKIFDYNPPFYFAYKIIKTIPKKPMIHEKGWLEFTEYKGETRVDWHSNFTISTPVIGGLIAWFIKIQMSKAFLKRLDYLDNL